MNRTWLMLGSVSAFTAVLLGAFAAHGLKKLISVDMISIFSTGVDYQFYHSFGLFICAIYAKECLQPKALDYLSAAAGLFMAGIVLFSGSLYLYALTMQKWLGPVTPLGGGCFLLGWACLGLCFWRNKNNSEI
ncbi:DUF423 domain-containing protein [Shewanella sp. SR44-3]|uniref:DUF423 domain-containing protein n=1 Tax=unclassified Shewanella TaxID=196818 RepID=UPI0015F922E2|nr:DUF423 domain-containing protein [Shewanella sp. SR44-3]MBB1269863.1 DUF423 domain-containing protein [Shewanella sp. SR44-3]